MPYNLKDNYCYYLIRQIIKDKKAAQIKLYNVNEESIISLVEIIPGNVSVYMYDDNDNSRIDLTDKLGKKEDISSINETSCLATLQFYSNTADYHNKNIFINNILLPSYHVVEEIKSIKEKLLLKKRWGREKSYEYLTYKLKGITTKHNYYFNTNLKNENSLNKGNEYELFIGKKYEDIGKEVTYHGIEKNKKDNGIDLIINDTNNITFVQCKNWISNEHYKLNQKDIRAFIGDCYMYIFNNGTKKNTHFHFIVSDEKLLTKSAELYVKENKKLKYKVVPYEIIN